MAQTCIFQKRDQSS